MNDFLSYQLFLELFSHSSNRIYILCIFEVEFIHFLGISMAFFRNLTLFQTNPTLIPTDSVRMGFHDREDPGKIYVVLPKRRFSI